jgi:hypothetical protein
LLKYFQQRVIFLRVDIMHLADALISLVAAWSKEEIKSYYIKTSCLSKKN